MTLPRGFKAQANRISVRLRQQIGLRSTDPIDPLHICAHFEIVVIKLSELRDVNGGLPGQYFLGVGSKKFSAVTMPIGGQRLIVHNDRHSETRQRSNIAHELAHCFLGHNLTPPLLSNGDRDRHAGIEEEAAFLGGAILMPNEAAHHIMRSGIRPNVAEEVYGVSSSMLTYRLRVSGATTVAARSAARAAAFP